MPNLLRSDRGIENVTIAAMHNYLHNLPSDENKHLMGSSTTNKVQSVVTISVCTRANRKVTSVVYYYIQMLLFVFINYLSTRLFNMQFSIIISKYIALSKINSAIRSASVS